MARTLITVTGHVAGPGAASALGGTLSVRLSQPASALDGTEVVRIPGGADGGGTTVALGAGGALPTGAGALQLDPIDLLTPAGLYYVAEYILDFPAGTRRYKRSEKWQPVSGTATIDIGSIPQIGVIPGVALGLVNAPLGGDVSAGTITATAGPTKTAAEWAAHGPVEASGTLVTATGSTTARTMAEIEGDVAKVEGDGAIGDGTTDDTQAVWRTIARAGVGGTVVFKPGKIYLLKAPIIPLAQQTWVGYGSAIKRANETRTTLTAGKSAGASPGVVAVASSAGFYAGMYVTFKSLTVPDDEAGSSGELRNWLVTSVGTGTVALSGGALGKSYVAGDYLVTGYDMVWDALVTQDKNRVLGLIIDGNNAGNPTFRRWECVSGLRMASDHSVVRDCIFLNSPSDAIEYSGTGYTIEHNTILDTQGNGIHLGASYSGEITGNYILNCNIRGVNNGHADGGIIASNLVYDTRVNANHVEQCNGFPGIGSWNTTDDYGLTLTGNTLKTVGGPTRGGIEVFTNTGTINGRLTISGNALIDARVIAINGTNMTGDWSLTNGLTAITISGNYFESTGISVIGAVCGVAIDGNTFWKAPAVGASGFLPNNEHVYIGSWTHNVSIGGANVFIDTANTTRECIRTGGADAVVVTGASIRGYGRHIYFATAGGVGSTNCRASTNTLTDPAIDLFNTTAECRGCSFTNNTASVAAAISGAVVWGYNGTVIMGNQITTASTIGIRLFAGTAGNQGAIALHNILRGSGLGVAAIYADNGPNNVVEWNYAKTGAAFTDAAGTNTFTNNKAIAP